RVEFSHSRVAPQVGSMYIDHGETPRTHADHDRVLGTLPMCVHVRLPGMLHATVVRSPAAHGQLRGIDATAARAVPGVVAVLTAADLDGAVPVFGEATADQPVLADGRVRYAGEPVALVVAEDEFAASEAAAAVELDVQV